MDDNTKVLIHELMEKANVNALDTERLETLVFMLLDGAELSYTGKALSVGNDEVIMAYLHAISPTGYEEKLAALQKEKENKNGK